MVSQRMTEYAMFIGFFLEVLLGLKLIRILLNYRVVGIIIRVKRVISVIIMVSSDIV